MIHGANSSIEMQMWISRCIMQMLYSNMQNVDSHFLMQMLFFKDTNDEFLFYGANALFKDVNVNFYSMMQMLFKNAYTDLLL